MAAPAAPAATPAPVTPPPFDYRGLTPADRTFVISRTTAIHERTRRTVEQLIATGRDLTAVKARLGYGRFCAWLAAEFAWSPMTARRLMLVAERFGSTNLVELRAAPSALYLLASASEETVSEAKALMAAGEHVSREKAVKLLESQYEHAPATGVMTCHSRFKAHPCVQGRTRHAGTFPTEQEASRACERVKEYAERLSDLWGLAVAGRFDSREWGATLRRLTALAGELTDAERRLAAKLSPPRTTHE